MYRAERWDADAKQLWFKSTPNGEWRLASAIETIEWLAEKVRHYRALWLEQSEMAGGGGGVMALSVGDKVYQFDINHHVYKQENGRSVGGPIYRDHFVPVFIVGEAGRSWLVSRREDGNYSWKHAKSKLGLMTEKEVNDACWLNSNRYGIGRCLERCGDAEVIKAVAALLHYTEVA